MKKELLDKEVICIYDTRAIQKFIFSNNNNIDIIGAGNIVSDVLPEALNYALENNKGMPLGRDEYCMSEMEDPDNVPYFDDQKIRAQVVTIGGGNAFMLYRTGRPCSEVSKAFSRYILEHTYSLQVAVAAVAKTENMDNDINQLYLKLDRIKNTEAFSHPLGTLPIIKKEKTSGAPVIGTDKDTGEEISMQTFFRREKVRTDKHLQNKVRTLGELSKYNDKLAYIHMDGNSMGLTIGRIMGSISDYKEGIIARRRLNMNIMNQYVQTLADSKDWLLTRMSDDGIPAEESDRYFQELHTGGDDINLAMNARYSFMFVEHFIKEVSKKTLWNDDRLGMIYFSVCAGIALVSPDVSCRMGLWLAESCCETAKNEAKKPINLINGNVGNWIDFHINEDSYINDIDTIREDRFKTDTNTYLCLRPYCVDRDRSDTPTYYEKFKALCHMLQKGIYEEKVTKMLLDGYGVGMSYMENQLKSFELLGGEIPDSIGKAYVRVAGREGSYANWFDALQVMDYMGKASI